MMKLKDNIEKWVRSGNSNAVAKRLCLKYIRPGDRVLDIGPGKGELLHALRNQYVSRIILYALDRHQVILDNMPKKTHVVKMNLNDLMHYEQGLRRIPFADNAFQVIICTELIEHIIFPQLLLSEMARMLVKDGLLIMTTPNIHCLGNRLAMLLGTDKVFPNVGSEGFIAKLNFDPYGHLAHYSFSSLAETLSPWFNVSISIGAGFKVPGFRYLQPLFSKLFPTLGNNIVMLCRRKDLSGTDLSVITCPNIESPQLILPDGRCLHPQVHSQICNRCKYFHKDFLHKRGRRNNNINIQQVKQEG